MINFVTCDHKNCGNLVYDTEPYEIVYNSRLEFLLKLNPELKRICNAYHGYASHKDGLQAGIHDPCKCSRCVKQKIIMDIKSKACCNFTLIHNIECNEGKNCNCDPTEIHHIECKVSKN